jgi:hypothetical protein
MEKINSEALFYSSRQNFVGLILDFPVLELESKNYNNTKQVLTFICDHRGAV